MTEIEEIEIERAIKKYESYYKWIAKKFFSLPPMMEWEDLEQAGRIVVSEIAKKRPEKLNRKNYVIAAIKNAMAGEIRRWTGKSLKSPISLDAPLYEDSKKLADVIPDSSRTIEDIVYRNEIIEALKLPPSQQKIFEELLENAGIEVSSKISLAKKQEIRNAISILEKIGYGKVEGTETYAFVLLGLDNRFPPNFFKDNKDAFLLVKNLFESSFGSVEEAAKSKDVLKMLRKNRLYTVYNKYSPGGLKTLFANLCPELEPWQIKQARKWGNAENRRKAIKQLFEEKKISLEKIPNYATQEFFEANGLYGLLRYYNGSPFLAINDAYPNRFKPWEFVNTQRNYWTDEEGLKKENIVEAIDWLCGKTGKSAEQLRREDFINNRLGGMLSQCFGSCRKAINFYLKSKGISGQVKEAKKWQDPEARRNYLRNFFEQKGIPVDEIPKLGLERLLYNDCRGLLYYYNSVYSAINDAYPNRFKPWEFKKVGNGFWGTREWPNKERVIEAMDWLLEKTRKYVDELRYEDFKLNNLFGMLKACFGSMKKAIAFYKKYM